jgi:hypothetical protein
MLHNGTTRRLDRGRVRVDTVTVFQVSDQVLLRTKEFLDATEVGKLRPRREGPFRVEALAGPNAYTLSLPLRFKCSPTFNADRLKPYHSRPDRAPPTRPCHGPRARGGVRRRAAPQPANHSRPHSLPGAVAGADSDSWEPVEHLTNCPERIAEQEAAAPRRPKARRRAARDALHTGARRPPSAPGQKARAGCKVAPPGQPSVGSALLYWWPEYGWQLGRVLRRTRQGTFSHVLRYRRPEAVFTSNVDTLQESASYGVRWVLLRPASSSEGPAPRSGLP